MQVYQSIDDEWEQFTDNICSSWQGGYVASDYLSKDPPSSDIISPSADMVAPTATPVYISTKTKIAYLNSGIDIEHLFWNIPVIDYSKFQIGILKKQIKISTLSKEEFDLLQNRLIKETNVDQHIICHIETEDTLKDVRKISIGISKRDLIKNRCKKKGAFYNCFVLIIRIRPGDIFQEYHVKLFNTGKIEIPGIQQDHIFGHLLEKIIQILQPYYSNKLEYNKHSEETVLINSNFHCGFIINRNELFQILKYKYHIHAIYDPCSYPGIQCKYYYNKETFEPVNRECIEIQCMRKKKPVGLNIIEVSFMIFRTGSVLIVGKCDEHIIHKVYKTLTNLLSVEYPHICQCHGILKSIKIPKQTLKKKMTIMKH